MRTTMTIDDQLLAEAKARGRLRADADRRAHARGGLRASVTGPEARANLVPGAYLAALAIESGSEWITTDRESSRLPGLRWCHPLAVR